MRFLIKSFYGSIKRSLQDSPKKVSRSISGALVDGITECRKFVSCCFKMQHVRNDLLKAHYNNTGALKNDTAKIEDDIRSPDVVRRSL